MNNVHLKNSENQNEVGRNELSLHSECKPIILQIGFSLIYSAVQCTLLTISINEMR